MPSTWSDSKVDISLDALNPAARQNKMVTPSLNQMQQQMTSPGMFFSCFFFFKYGDGHLFPKLLQGKCYDDNAWLLLLFWFIISDLKGRDIFSNNFTKFSISNGSSILLICDSI